MNAVMTEVTSSTASDGTEKHYNGVPPPTSPLSSARRKVFGITAVEEDEEDVATGAIINTSTTMDDVIPGPPPGVNQNSPRDRHSTSSSRRRSLISRVLNASVNGGNRQSSFDNSKSNSRSRSEKDELQLSLTDHHWSGDGILASRTDLNLPFEQFAAGCNLLQAAASGNIKAMQELLVVGKTHVNFRDYDRRTALHVAASEGHLEVCRYLVQQGARINRSDRWGGSPLDDAHRHRHQAVIEFLRQAGATTGSANRSTNLITAAAEGDVDEVRLLVQSAVGTSSEGVKKLDVNKGDYDKRTALHLAAGEGHAQIVSILCEAGADVNVEDRWMRRPLDDAITGSHQECIYILKRFGATEGKSRLVQENDMDGLNVSGRRVTDNMNIDFDELEMVDRIGSGAFGEIYKCRWRGTLVAAKIIKSAKIRRDWVNKRMIEAIKDGHDVDDAVKEMDDAEMEQNEKDLAIADFRQEISVLKSLRHPHIVLLLAYSTTENYECLISELMKCSLLDVFKSHIVQGTKMPHRTQIVYATQLALGMNYLHTCKPPIIHRDLKPANLLIDHSGVLKISDFGLSKIRPDPTKMESETYVMTGETGSYRFMAPECYRHEDYDETVDVYSFAMILFYLLVGRPPWPNLSGLVAVKKAAVEGDRPNIPRDLDQRLQNLLQECWDENSRSRPPFSTIVKVLNSYSRSVFKVEENSVVAAEPHGVGAKCSCVIL